MERLPARREREFPKRPDWCFLPLQGAPMQVNPDDAPLPPHQVKHIAIIGALATWRMSQGVHRFDPDLAAAVAATPLAGELSTALLYRLPEWSI